MSTRHLIHVGFPKCGSTSLQAWFAERPDLAYAPHSLGGYAGTSALTRAAAAEPPPVWCVTSDEGFLAPRGRTDTEDQPTDPPVALRVERVCDQLAALFHGATILIVTRGFQGVMASLYSEYVRFGGTRRLDQFHSTDAPRAVVGSMPIDYFDYSSVIKLYESRFGEKNVIVLPYELMRDSPESFISTLEGRLGLPPSSTPLPRLNPHLSAAELVWYPRFSLVSEKASALLGSHRNSAFAAYRARIGSPKLRRTAALLASFSHPSAPLSSEVLDQFRGRADVLADRADYASYRADYLIEG
jgi:hypothetical protein